MHVLHTWKQAWTNRWNMVTKSQRQFMSHSGYIIPRSSWIKAALLRITCAINIKGDSEITIIFFFPDSKAKHEEEEKQGGKKSLGKQNINANRGTWNRLGWKIAFFLQLCLSALPTHPFSGKTLTAWVWHMASLISPSFSLHLTAPSYLKRLSISQEGLLRFFDYSSQERVKAEGFGMGKYIKANQQKENKQTKKSKQKTTC